MSTSTPVRDRDPGQPVSDAPADTASPLPDPSTAPRLRVLIVDDNHDAALLLAEALSAVGHLTTSAHDGPTALEMAVRFNPHVALLDIGLPAMDGFELARQFAGRSELAGVKLVAVTGYSQEQYRQRSKEAGFAAHVVKPVDLDELNCLIEQLAASPSDR